MRQNTKVVTVFQMVLILSLRPGELKPRCNVWIIRPRASCVLNVCFVSYSVLSLLPDTLHEKITDNLLLYDFIPLLQLYCKGLSAAFGRRNRLRKHHVKTKREPAIT
jgi:hypothetical protein